MNFGDGVGASLVLVSGILLRPQSHSLSRPRRVIHKNHWRASEMHHPGAHPERETIDLECRVPHHFCPSMDDPTDIPQLTPWMHQECCALTSLWCQIRPSHLVWRLENPLPTRQRWFNPFPADAWTKTSDQRRCDATGTDARLPSSGKACGQWIPGSRNLEQQTSNSQLQSSRGDPHAWHNDRKLRWHTGGGAYATRVAYLNRRSCTTILYAQKGYHSRIEQHVSRIQPPAKLSRDQLQ